MCSHQEIDVLKGAKEQPAIEYGAIDLHTRRSQIRIVNEEGAVLLDRRIDTTRADLDRVWGRRSRMRLLMESSTESECPVTRLGFRARFHNSRQ